MLLFNMKIKWGFRLQWGGSMDVNLACDKNSAMMAITFIVINSLDVQQEKY